MAVLAFVDAIAPNAMLPLLGRLAKPGWRNRDSRPLDPADALTEPSADAELRSGALGSRPSVLVRLRDMATLVAGKAQVNIAARAANSCETRALS